MHNPHPLALQCESATADEQREMPEQAFYAIYPAPDETCEMKQWAAWTALTARFYRMLEAEAWESAALMLVPEGWQWQLFSSGTIGMWYKAGEGKQARFGDLIFPGVALIDVSTTAVTLALSITAASLRAHAALANGKESDDERLV